MTKTEKNNDCQHESLMLFEFTNNKRAFKMKFLTMRIKNNYDVEFDEKYHPESKKDKVIEEEKRKEEILRQLHDEQYKDTKYI